MHQIRLPDWARARGAALNAFASLEPQRTVLLVIDMQNAFIAEGEVYGNPHARDIVPAINALARALRDAGGRAIWTRQTYVAEGPFAPAPWQYDLSDPAVAAATAALTADASGHGLYPAVEVAAADLVIDKHRYGAFSCPARAVPEALARLAPEMLVIAGTLTNVCCETTAREAYMAGYKVIVAADACAAVTDAEHNAALMNLRLNFADVKRAAEIVAMISAASP
ncbi:MAG TPA: cysteine hydrolase [Caulobacteraceae bacterium]|nr:cysteine hydrolase [Caulobacteraceae bacterium]